MCVCVLLQSVCVCFVTVCVCVLPCVFVCVWVCVCVLSSVCVRVAERLNLMFVCRANVGSYVNRYIANLI